MPAAKKAARAAAPAKSTPSAGKKAPASQPKAAAAPAPAKAPKAAKAPKVDKAEKTEKPKKPKLVRDSFTIPKPEYAVLDELKLRAAKLGHPAKKSEVLRAGIKALAALPEAAFLAALGDVPTVKTGRPAKA